MKKSAFTLIELLVVIVIIGILATISVATFSDYQYKARVARVQSEVRPLIDAILMARTLEGKTLLQITANACTDCHQCRTGTSLKNLPETHPCVQTWKSALEKIAESSGMDVSHFIYDPWGSPYMLNENEGESPLTPCWRDDFFSVGPDGIRGTSDDVGQVFDGGDPTVDESKPLFIPFYNTKVCGR